MCGILGLYPFKGCGLSGFSDALSLLAHRGPDHSGTEVVDELMLGHTRLAVLDLDSRSNQPMFNKAKDITVVFNGEIYNFLDLKEELASEFAFTTNSDTEVILAAYEKWGSNAFKRLHGMFAISIYDRKQKELLLARDKVGKKPLFYCQDGNSFLFASEARAIAHLLKNDVEIDQGGLNNYFARGCTGVSQSVYSGIKKLPSGSLLRVKLGEGVSVGAVERYWELTVGTNASRRKTEGDLVEQFDEKLNSAISDRLHADVPLGCFLSGGLDSSIISAIAKNHVKGKLKTFTVRFLGSNVNESDYANKMAAFIGSEHHEIDVGADLIDEIPKIIELLDEPFADSSFIPMYFMCNEAKKHVTVCLAGDGGDELLAGYGHYDDFAREHFIDDLLPSFVRRNIGRCFQFLPERHKTRSLKRLSIDDPIERMGAYYSNFFNVNERGRLFKGKGFQANRHPESEILSFFKANVNWVENVCQADFRSYMVEDILVKVDRMSMLSGLEVRSPLLDSSVAEFCFSQVPVELKRNGSVKKYLLKELGKRYLPSDFVYERKQGFSVPLGEWFKGELGELLTNRIDLNPTGFFDYNYVRKMLKLHRLGVSNYSKRLFAVLVWEIWFTHQQEIHLNNIQPMIKVS